MKGICRLMNNVPVAEIKQQVKAGDTVLKDGELIVVNQSTCVFFDSVIVGVLKQQYNYKEGEELNLVWDCRKEPCGYPFCGCKGEERIMRDANKDPRM
jgi:hypothetical protein